MVTTRTGYVASTASLVPIVSGKWYPVSRKRTSTPAAMRDTRSTTTASAIEDATASLSPKVCAAQATICSAVASSRSTRALCTRLRTGRLDRCGRSVAGEELPMAVCGRPSSTATPAAPGAAACRPMPLCCALAVFMPALQSRGTSRRRSVGTICTPRRRACSGRRRCPRWPLPAVGRGPPRRSTGNRTGAAVARPTKRPRWDSRCLSCEVLLFGAGDPIREALFVRALGSEAAHHPLDVVGYVFGGDLQAAQLAAESGGNAESAAQVDLEALDLPTLLIGDDHSLEADIRDLEASARVGAAVHVDGQRLGEVGQPTLELVDEPHCSGLGFDDRELAVLDPGAGHRLPAKGAGSGGESQRFHGRDQGLDLVLCQVEHEQLLLGSCPDPSAAVLLRNICDLAQQRSVDPADLGREPGVEAPVALRVHPHVIPGARRRRRGRPVDQRPPEVLRRLQYGAKALRTPVMDEELQPCAVAKPAISVVAEDRSAARPHVGHLLQRHPGAESYGKPWIRRQ